MKPEATLQCQLVHFLRLKQVFVFAPLNEAFMTLTKGQKNYGLYQHYKNMGFEEGICDVWIVHNEKVYVIELKAPGKKTTPKQDGVIARLKRQNVPVLVTDSFDMAVGWIERYNII